MGWFTALVLFTLIWWITLFAVLPFGVRPVDRDGETGWRGAPAKPLLLKKVIATTLVSLVIWGGSVALIRSDYLSFRRMAAEMSDD